MPRMLLRPAECPRLRHCRGRVLPRSILRLIPRGSRLSHFPQATPAIYCRCPCQNQIRSPSGRPPLPPLCSPLRRSLTSSASCSPRRVLSLPWSAEPSGMLSSAAGRAMSTSPRTRRPIASWQSSATGPTRSGRSGSTSALSACAKAARRTRSPPTAARVTTGPRASRSCPTAARLRTTWPGATSR